MSVSEFEDRHTTDELPPIGVTEEDPLQLSPDGSPKCNDDSPSDGKKKKNIYGLGILSSAHLDKQPMKVSPVSNKASASPISPGEIVKVQFVQSGGKVIPVSQLQASISNGLGGMAGIGPGDLSGAPRNATKKKIQNLLSKVTGGGTSKVSSSTKTRSVASKYQTFDDDDGEHQARRVDITNEGEEDDETDDDNVTSASTPLTSSKNKGCWDTVNSAVPVLQL
jgi:hypothetical protein